LKKKRSADSRESISTTWWINEGLGVMNAMEYLGMGGKLAGMPPLAKGNPYLNRDANRDCLVMAASAGCPIRLVFPRRKMPCLESMEPFETEIRAREAEARLAKGEALSRAQRLALLARLLAVQDTRQERKYGQA
jgi:hypothetical protein